MVILLSVSEYVSYRQDTTRLLSPASTTNTAKEEEETATDTDIKRNITRKWRNYFFKVREINTSVFLIFFCTVKRRGREEDIFFKVSRLILIDFLIALT